MKKKLFNLMILSFVAVTALCVFSACRVTEDKKDGEKDKEQEVEISTPCEFFEFELLDDDTYSIKAEDEGTLPAKIIIPSKNEDGKAVTVIGPAAFKDCARLKSVTIPGSVTTIRAEAFLGCTALTSVTIGKGVEKIENSVFKGCTGLTTVVVNENNQKFRSENDCIIERETDTLVVGFKCSIIPSSVTSIGNNAFNGCTDLASVTIPDSVTNINAGAFGNCTDLKSVAIGTGVQTIGAGAFMSCTALSSIIIPDNVTSIDFSAFSYCTALTSVTIGNGVTSIGSNAFENCTALASISIGKGVTSIGSGAFTACTNLRNIIYQGTIEEWQAIRKGRYWKSIAPATVVHCTDGDVAI